jgi:xanthine dehydrogenase accessory factor
MNIANELNFLFENLLNNSNQPMVLATVVQTWGSSPRPVGSHLVINAQGQFQGSVSGGCIEGAVISEALELIGTTKNKMLTFSVSNEQAWDVGLSCGGEIKIMLQGLTHECHQSLFSTLKKHIANRTGCILFFNTDKAELSLLSSDNFSLLEGSLTANQEQQASLAELVKSGKSTFIDDESAYFVRPFLPDYKLYIIGAVHIAQKLAPMAQLANYDVTIIDPRGAFADTIRFENVNIVNEWPDDFFDEHPLDNQCAVVTLSHDPKIDDPALIAALNSPVFYIGALGSNKTHGQRIERLTEEGLAEQLERICAPIGIKLGGRAPEEIAISIIAQLTQYRYQKA